MAEMLDAGTELLQGSRGQAQRHRHFDAFTEIEALQRGLIGETRVCRAIIADDANQIAAQRGDGKIVAVRVGLGPLREIVREVFRQKVVAAESLKRVVENRNIAAVLKASEQLGESACGLVPDTG